MVYDDGQPRKGFDVTLAHQFVANPGYNRDRGPANVFAVRFHGGF